MGGWDDDDDTRWKLDERGWEDKTNPLDPAGNIASSIT